MQSSAISIAPPISPFNKPRLNPNSLRLSSSKRFNIVNCNNTCGFNLSRRIDGLFSLKLKSKNDFVVVRASSAMAESSGEGGEEKKEKVKDEFVVRASSAMAEGGGGEGGEVKKEKVKDEFVVRASSAMAEGGGGEGAEVKKEKVKDEFVVRASSAMAESADNGGGEVAKEKANAFGKTLELGILFGLWYLFNIYFNIYNKQVLKVYQFPVTVTLCQFFVGAVLVCIMWTFNFYRPKVSAGQLAAILPLAIVHTLGNLFTNMSLGKVAVSFTHTIKAMEPFFSVLLSAAFLGETPTTPIILSLLPIVGGVALASVTEASFNWAGFWSAMASNLTNQSRNVLSKKVMVNKEESLDNITLFSIITVMSFVLLAPATIFMEGVKFTPGYLEAAGLNVQQVYVRSLLAALCFHAYQQVSYMILQKVSPVTHSVGNCVKRVVVITSSVIFFKTPVSPINALGTGIALAGVFLYSRVKRLKAKPKAA